MTIAEDVSHKPATESVVETWTRKFGLSLDVVLDPTFKACPKSGSYGMPYHLLVDPRTMRIAKIVQGDSPSVDLAVETLMRKNGG